ncbi:E3 binding domain-containing protein, partial [Pelagibacteraceae bacterium]|nr:E3 binding domain-containing protein [Pelagibacteraceae bacterium]
MAIKVLMPALSPTMSEGIINKWLVNIGDTVLAGDILAEIETDKATMEVEAVDEGEITHLIDTTLDKQIAVNSVIALINGSKDEKLEDYNDKDQTVSSDKKNETSVETQTNTEVNKNQKIESSKDSNTNQNANFASPFVKKFSKDNNIDLTFIKGSGPD